MLNEDLMKIIIYPSLQKAKKDLPGLVLDKIDDNLILYGAQNAILDSLNLVGFVFIIEDEIEKALKKKIRINTDDIIGVEVPPFASLKNLCSFLLKKIGEVD